MTPNFCGFSVWNLVYVTIPAPRILRWFPEFQKIFAPLIWRDVALGWNSSHFMGYDFSLPCSPHTHPPVIFLSQINRVHNLPSWFFKIHYNMVLPSIIRFSKSPPSLNFPTKTFYVFLVSPRTVLTITFFMIWSLRNILWGVLMKPLIGSSVFEEITTSVGLNWLYFKPVLMALC